MKLVTRLLTRYWGYLAVVIAVAGFFLHSIGLAVVIVLALAALGYFLFQAPMWCGAETRKQEWCRNNSHGLLLGCHLGQHKLQRVKQTFTPAGGRTLVRTTKSVSGGLSTIGGVVAGSRSSSGSESWSSTNRLTLKCQAAAGAHPGCITPRSAQK